MKLSRNLFLSGLTLFVMFFVLNILSPEYLDDYLYKYQFINGVAADMNYPIENIGDICSSQIEHYKVFNGRSVVHWIVQLFTGILGKNIFNIINSFVFLGFCFLLAKVSMKKITVYRVMTASLFSIVLLPSFKDCFLWMTGSVNYLWSSFAVLIYLYILNSLSKEHISVKYCLLGSFMIFFGWTHEGIAFPLAISSALYFFFRRTNKFSAATPFVFFFLIGALFCTFSPATMSRGGFESGLSLMIIIQKIITGLMLIFKLKAFLLMTFVLLIALYRKKDVLILIKENAIIVGAIIVSLGVVFISGFSSTRSAFGLEFYSLILLLKTLSLFNVPLCLKKAVAPFYALMMIFIFFYSFQSWRLNHDLYKKIQTTNDGIVAYDELNVPKCLSSYILKPLETKHSGYYNSFSFSSWENRYIAASFGKDSLAFFPTEFINKTKSGYSFKDFNIKTDLPFYCKSIEDNENIKDVRYVLRKAQKSDIPFYFRPFADRMQRYSASYIDSNDFEVQNIYGQKLLFVKKNQMLSDRLISIEVLY